MLQKIIMLLLLVTSVTTANATTPTYVFDFTKAGLTGNQTATANSVINNPAVSFQYTSRANATAPWYMGPLVSPANIVNLGYYGYNGTLPTSATGLDANTTSPVLMKFASLIDINSITISEDNSRYGQGFNNQLFFVDAAGKYLNVSQDFFSANSFTYSPNLVGVAGIVLPFTSKFITSISINPVPEPETYAMLLAGLGMLGFMKRRRNNKQA